MLVKRMFNAVAQKKLTPLAELLKDLRAKHRFTVRALAQVSGVSRNYISMIEQGYDKRTGKPIKPHPDVLKLLGEPLGGSYDALIEAAGYMTGEEIPPFPPPPQQTAEDLLRQLEVRIKTSPILVPETTQPASAGWGISVEGEYWPYLPEPAEREHRFIAVEVSGDCMEPTIRAGHKVIVDLDASPKNGDIVLAIHDGESLVKMLEKRNSDMYLVALKKRPPLKVNEGTRVLGVVRTVTYRP